MKVKITDLSDKARGLRERWKKNRWLLLGLVLGLLLLLIPWGGGQEESGGSTPEVPGFSLAAEEEKLAAALGRIDGVGKVSVTLTLHSGIQRQAAWDDESNYRSESDGGYETSGGRTLVRVQSGSGCQEPVILNYRYPEYRGALIIAEHLNASLELEITSAVSALTGLSSDKVSVMQGGVK